MFKRPGCRKPLSARALARPGSLEPAPARTGTAASCGRAAGASAQPSGRAPWAYVFRPCLVIRTGPHAVACERGQGTSDNSRPDT